MEAIPTPVLYQEIFVNLDLSGVFSALVSCKKWSKAGKDEVFWEKLAKNLWRDHFALEKYEKPEQKDWKWVCQSKTILKDSTNFTGVGCKDEGSKRYEGEWIAGEQKGYGCLYWPPTGDRYQGEFGNNVPNGFGVRVWGKGRWEGDRYEGQFSGNFRTGKGKYFWPKGDMYEGDFFENTEHGQGMYRWANGNRYEGDFFRNKQHGKGIHYWANGNKYEGDYVDDKRHGFGVVTWANGNRYEGDFCQNKQHGRGVHYWANGNRFEGDYIDDQKQGEGTFHEASGWVIRDKWLEGLPATLPHTLNPVIQECIKKKICTFNVTGQKYYGQLFYTLTSINSTKSGQKPARVCAVCAEICVPKFGEAILMKPVFAGSLYCDCGFGFDPIYKCHAHTERKKLC